MARNRSLKRELIATLLSIAISIIGAVDLIGHPARMVHILTIFAGGLGAGVGLGRAIDRYRAERKARLVEVATTDSRSH
jgi:hypothetical protein